MNAAGEWNWASQQWNPVPCGYRIYGIVIHEAETAAQ